jgi:hypothetical protein
MARGPLARIAVERTGRNDHSTAAAGEMGHRRTAAAAEACGETGGLRQVEARHLGLAADPAEGLRRDDGVGGVGAAAGFPAARAMAMEEMGEGPADFVGDGAAEAASVMIMNLLL